MNASRLQQLFAHYIDKFEYINNPELNENYKWEIVKQYQEIFNLDAPDLAGMLTEAWRITSNLIDSQFQQPFYALIAYAREEPETVRTMFRDLFADDDGNLKIRQQKISAFIAKSEELKEKYAPGSWRYTNDQRSVMSYLFFHDPEANYLFKSTEAHEFADCVEFLEDWGAGENFKLDIYYRMCDELVEAMRQSPALMATNASRYENEEKDLYDDPNLHLLAFDMIYSSQVYHLYDGISYSHPNSAEKKLYRERIEKAGQLKDAYDQARADYEKVERIRQLVLEHLHVGDTVSHKSFGQGEVAAIDGQNVAIQFPGQPAQKKFMLLPSLGGGFISLGTPDDQIIKENAKLLQMDTALCRRLKSAEDALLPYQQYL